MGVFEQFPYTNFHDLNLDWILGVLKKFDKKLDEFVSNATLKYADPFQWNITTQYPANMVVLDPTDGTAYISLQAVPAGIAIGNTKYWGPVYKYQELAEILKKQIAGIDFGTTNIAPQSITKYSLCWYQNKLYRAQKDIAESSIVPFADPAYMTAVTVEQALQNIQSSGDLSRTAENIIDNISGDYTEVAGDKTETYNNRTTHVTADNTQQIDGTLFINAGKPIKYSAPAEGTYYNTVPMQDTSDNPYNIITVNNRTLPAIGNNIVSDKNYDEDITLTGKHYSNNNSGISSNSNIMIQDATLRDFKITSTNNPIAYINGKSDINNMEMTGTGADGLQLQNNKSGGTKIHNSNITSSDYAVLFLDNESGYDNVSIIDNSINSTNGDAIEINTPRKTVDGTIIANNFLSPLNADGSANKGFGVGVAGGINSIITGNIVKKCQTEGFHVEDNSTNIIISNNIVDSKDCSYGCRIYNSNVITSHNFFRNSNNTGNTGISFDYTTSGYTDTAIADGNVIEGFQYGIRSTYNNTTIAGNNIIKNVTTALRCSNYSGVAILENCKHICAADINTNLDTIILNTFIEGSDLIDGHAHVSLNELIYKNITKNITIESASSVTVPIIPILYLNGVVTVELSGASSTANNIYAINNNIVSTIQENNTGTEVTGLTIANNYLNVTIYSVPGKTATFNMTLKLKGHIIVQ